MSARSARSFVGLLFAVFCCVGMQATAQKLEFAPVNPQELQMKDNPKQPGAHAMILEWRDTTDDHDYSMNYYKRIKIFTAEGKKFADIEIPYFKDFENIHNLKARTIHPDGTIVNFEGQAIDKMIAKARSVKYNAKTFSLPDVQPGSVIEYMYRIEGLRKAHSWNIQGELYVQKAVLQWNPSGAASNCLTFHMPHGENTVVKNGAYTLDVTDVPAFDEESFSPPDGVVKTRLLCWYTRSDPQMDVDKFWKEYTKSRFKVYDDFVGHRKAVEQEANNVLTGATTQEQKLQKIYDSVQAFRNLSFEKEKTAQEQKRDKVKDINNIEDVLKRSYGEHIDLNLLFFGMVRAAGFETNIVEMSRRDSDFFNKTWKDDDLLVDAIIEVKLDGKLRYFDPGTVFCPFGVLRWRNSGVIGLRITKDTVEWVNSPDIMAVDAQRVRKADLKFEDGLLRGKVQVTYFAQRALAHRLDALDEDDIEQKNDLEDEAKGWLPQGATVKMVKVANAKDSHAPFIVDYEVEMAGVGSTVGSRILIPLAVFQGNDTNPLRHEKRKYAVYFRYAYSDVDDITIELPAVFEVQSLPNPRQVQEDVGVYGTQYFQSGKQLKMKRTLAISGVYYPVQYYSQLRAFFDQVATGDQDNAVLKEKQ